LVESNSNGYKTELEGIRAPLGIILYLIRRDNLDIYNIPIARITREYMEYLDLMERLEIELAGEFFVLAATLMRIKAQMLLRKDDDGEEDPRQDLIRSLIEYKKMIEAAKTFQELEEERRKIFTRPVPEAEKSYREEPVIDLSLYHVMKAFQEIMHQFEAADVREIELEEYTIEEKIIAVLEALRQDNQVLFKDLFKGSASRMELIVTVIALLELIKHAQVKVNQESAFGTIWLYRGDNFGRPMGAPEEWEDGPVPKGPPEPVPTSESQISREPAGAELTETDPVDESNEVKEVGAASPAERKTEEVEKTVDDHGRR
jgi:segregation and condensation protein A